MRVTVAAVGSRGDAVPFGALALRLLESGHDVTVVTHEALLPALPPQVNAIGVASDPHELLSGPAGVALRRGNLAALNRSRQIFAEFLSAFAEPIREIVVKSDVLVASTFAIPAVDEAIKQGVPVVRAHLWPEVEALDGPMPLLPYSWRLPAQVRRSARGALRTVEPYFAGLDGGWSHGKLNLQGHYPVGLTTTTHGSLYGYSPLVDPEPSSPSSCITGWWRTPSHRELSPQVGDLLNNGDQWIFVGFGSMHQSDPQHVRDVVAQACHRLGVRAFLQVPDVIDDPTGTVVAIGEEPHEELFARVVAVVHHGGSGTTATALSAGTPSVVVPHFADQYHWAHRLHELGVAPKPLPRRLLTARLLSARLQQAMAPDITTNAQRLGAQVAQEDGTGAAVAALEGFATE